MKIDLPSSPDAGLRSLGKNSLAQHIQELASDAFEGRFPGSPGETRTTGYLIEQFKSLGLAPGDPAAGYLQKVPLIGITAASPLHLSWTQGHKSCRFALAGSSWPGASERLKAYPFTIRRSFLPVMEWWHPSMTGMTTKTWM